MKKQNIKTNQEGFTIIEVVLVLAIAGLIFLMVFVALPALQRSQKDTARRNDMARVDTALTNFQTNNSSAAVVLPAKGQWDADGTSGGFSNGNPTNCDSSSACRFIRDYMNSGVSDDNAKLNTFEDPNGIPYSLVITDNIKTTPNPSSTYSLTPTKSGGKGTATLTRSGTSPDWTYTLNSDSFNAHVVFIVPGARCNGESSIPSGKNNYAIMYRLEGSGVYCIDDQ